MAHIALAHGAAFGIELRHTVGAIPHTILAAKAGFRRVQHNSSVVGLWYRRSPDIPADNPDRGSDCIP